MKKISKSVYYQLLGLFEVHKRLEAQRHEVEKTVADLVGEESDDGHYFGHVSDSLFDQTDVLDMLRRLDIEVEDEER